MSDASTVSIAPAAPSPGGLVRIIAPGLVSASVLYVAATTLCLPRIPDASAAIDVFLAATLPGLLVITLLWAARPAAFPQPRRQAFVAVVLLAAAAASTLPMLFVAA